MPRRSDCTASWCSTIRRVSSRLSAPVSNAVSVAQGVSSPLRRALVPTLRPPNSTCSLIRLDKHRADAAQADNAVSRYTSSHVDGRPEVPEPQMSRVRGADEPVGLQAVSLRHRPSHLPTTRHNSATPARLDGYAGLSHREASHLAYVALAIPTLPVQSVRRSRPGWCRALRSLSLVGVGERPDDRPHLRVVVGEPRRRVVATQLEPHPVRFLSVDVGGTAVGLDG